MVGVSTVPFLSWDIRGLEVLKSHGKSLNINQVTASALRLFVLSLDIVSLAAIPAPQP